MARGKASPVIVAIDGRCGSGKTTLAAALSEKLDAPVIHADDFFLQKEQRTPERLAEAGGNLDRERLLREVILPLANGEGCAYRPYLCSTGTFGDEVHVPCGNVYIVEGSYSCHPELWEHYGVCVFVTVSPDEQMRRIISREGEEKAEMFRSRWIPMEERYFDAFHIMDKCDILYET